MVRMHVIIKSYKKGIYLCSGSRQEILERGHRQRPGGCPLERGGWRKMLP